MSCTRALSNSLIKKSQEMKFDIHKYKITRGKQTNKQTDICTNNELTTTTQKFSVKISAHHSVVIKNENWRVGITREGRLNKIHSIQKLWYTPFWTNVQFPLHPSQTLQLASERYREWWQRYTMKWNGFCTRNK